MQFVYTNNISPNSSALQEIFWNKDAEELVVLFWSGNMFKYTGFNSDDFRAFSNALSKGRFYSDYVKGNFRGEKLPEAIEFVYSDDVKATLSAPQTVEADVQTAPINVTINVYVNGNPEDVARAVERLAPSIRAVQNWRG